MAIIYTLAEYMANELLFDQLLAGKEPGHSVSGSCMLMGFFYTSKNSNSLNSSSLAIYSAGMYLMARCLVFVWLQT
jgi:hypothetical protein